MDNQDDTTTTEYDSGGSEGVDYTYEGQVPTRGDNASNQKRIERSPKRRTSPKGKRRETPTRCVCGAAGKGSDSESTASDGGTSDESGTEKRPCRPMRRRPSGHGHHDERPCSCEKEHKNGKKKSAKKSGKRTPYIEEYPDEPRPVILLKEHKLPRRFSNSDEKRIRGPEEHQLSSSLSKVQTMGKRPPWVSTHQSMRPPEEPHSEQQPSRRRRRQLQQEAPGGRFSGSDLDDSDSETGDPGPSRPRRSSRYEQTGGVEMASSVTRSSAWNHSSSPKYSSSWPLQQGSHYPERPAPRHNTQQLDHGGYESGDESEDIFDGEFEFDETTHRRRPRRPSSPPPPHHHHQVEQQQQQPHHQVQQRQRHHHQSQLQPQPTEPQLIRPRRVRPPRPPVARTIISRPSMAAMDQGHTRTSVAAATDLCDIWRGRPEDWESPYASDSNSDYDSDDHANPMMLLEGTPPARSSSPQLLPPRRSSDFRFGTGTDRRRSGSPSPVPYPRRARTWDAGDERFIGAGLLPPAAASTRGGRSRRAPSRAPTERSRWTVMAPEWEWESDGGGCFERGVDYTHAPYRQHHDVHIEVDTAPDPNETYYSYGFTPLFEHVVQAPSPPFPGASEPPRRRGGGFHHQFVGLPLSRGTPFTADEELEYGGGYEARRTRELLSPVPTRTAAARFNFDKSYSELARMLL